MKPIFKIILKYYLKYVTKLAIFIHKPVIVAISGSTNKSFARDEIKEVLKKKKLSVRANPKNFNTEIGLPLAILNLSSGYNSYRNWIPVIKKSLFRVFEKNFPSYLVLELGISKKGDMKYLLSIINPKISVITDITQRYLESFSGMDDLVDEYRLLVEKTKKDGLVILNFDNIRVKNLAKYSKAKVCFFGVGDGSQWQAKNIKRDSRGETFELFYDGKSEHLQIYKFGMHNILVSIIGKIIDENSKIL